jgi:hypothetical protein
LLLSVITLIFPFFISAQTYVTDTSDDHFSTYLRSYDKANITQVNMNRWLDHLDVCYDRLLELTGHTPELNQDGRITVKSVDYNPGGWAVAGNPILWQREYVAGSLIEINDNDDWCFGIIHEISHDFDDPTWNFHAELFATFKMLYIMDNEPGYISLKDRQYLENESVVDFTNANQAFNSFGIVRPSIEYWMIKIQNVIAADEPNDELDWEPLKNTFAYMLQYGNPSATGAEKFTMFINALDSFTNVDIVNDYRIGLTNLQKNQIKHFLDKGELSRWNDVGTKKFDSRTALRAYEYIPSGPIKLTWNEYLTTEDGYEIQYSVNGGDYQFLADVGANTREYTNSSLSTSNTYKFRIRAYSESSHINFRSYSFFSNEAEAIEVDPNNISINKLATSDGMSPDLAVDGKSGTRCIMLYQEPHYLTVDLQDLFAVDKFIIKHGGYNGDPNLNARDYQIQKSLDGQNWEVVESVTGNTESIRTHNLQSPVYASYFRLYITKASQTDDTMGQIVEFEIYRSTNSSVLTNVALNKPVTADDHVSNEVQENAVDGTIESNSKWCVMGANTHYVQVDLGASTDVSYFVVKHAGVKEIAEYTTSDFKIKTSLVNSNWDAIQPVFPAVVNNTRNITYHSISTPVTARYVRLEITKATQTPDNTARIFEFEVWGEEPSGPSGNITVSYENHETAATTNTIRKTRARQTWIFQP